MATDQLEIRTKYYKQVEDTLVINKTYFSLYLDHLEEFKKQTNFSNEEKRNKKLASLKQYKSQVCQFFRYLEENEISIKIATIDDVERHKTGRLKDALFFNALRELIFVISKVDKLILTQEDLDLFERKSESERHAYPLSIQEIVEIKNKLISQNDHESLFIFETFLNYGVQLEKFKKLKRENFYVDELRVTLDQGDKRILSKSLAELITKHENLPGQQKTANLQKNIHDIGELIQRDKLIWLDIKKTREKYFPVCETCGKVYPNSSEFWSLFEYKGDETKTKWMRCRICLEPTYAKEG